ncbi:MAG TPA: FtsX-like permease family protein [Acidimicrobiales bacterium]|nr:FtsX-like permease family protein [Acidimicrobiales bacterium]
MRKVTLKGLLAHKLRLALTSLAIVLGVTFISGTYVLTDTLHGLFSTLVSSVYQNIDFEVRGVAQFPGTAANAVRNPFPQSVLGTVSRVPGVEVADGQVGGYAQFLSPAGVPIANGGAPTIGLSFDPYPQLSVLRVVEGGPPRGPADVVIDSATAGKYGFHVGQAIHILFLRSARMFTISGIAKLGSAGNLAGATLAAFTLPTAQAVLDEVGQLNDINVVTKPGADKQVVERRIAADLPPGLEVVTGRTLADEETSSINQALSFFSTALLVFAFIALFVGAFTIFNTFSIIVGQRTRELALLRVVGASRRQVFRSVLAEAAIVGAASSLVGTGLGVLTAIGLEALLRGFGISLPTGPLVFEARTAVVAVAVGVGVTVVSAISPARRAVRIAPVVAITERPGTGDISSRRRFVTGAALFVLGSALLALGLTEPAVALVGLGAAFIFIGAAMLAPVVARPLAGLIGRPLAGLLGVPGKLGRQNSMRSPRRTAQTASALMIGIALVSAMAVFGASLSETATSSVDDAVKADLIITGTSAGPGAFSRSLAGALSALPGVTASLTVYGGQFELRQSVETLRAVSTTGLSQTVILHMEAGSTRALAAGDLLIDTTTARSDHLSVGSSVPVKFALTGPGRMLIGGIFGPNALIGSYVIGEAFYLAHYQAPLPGGVLLDAGNPDRVDKEAKELLKPYPTVQVQTRAQFEQAQISSVNQLLGLVYTLLGLAVLIALIGIVNTLMLSVLERTREIGLLRAVGMKRRQVRRMVRAESVILAVFGAVIGIVIGTGLGISLVLSLKQQGITDTAVPFSSLVAFLVLAALLGLVAASWPARRAAKLDVLAAIATE